MEIPQTPIADIEVGVPEFSDVVDWRIVGGTAVKVIRKYPWMSSIRRNGKHVCGGMLIDPEWVLTAKHCFRASREAEVWIGGLNFENETEFVKRALAKLIEHPDLDMALVKLEAPVLNKPVVKVNNNPNLPVGLQTDAVGWGRLTETGTTTTQLQEVTLPIVSGQKCLDKYGSNRFDPAKMLCAGHDEGVKDACQGDSGGPLVMVWDSQNPSTQYLVGVTSWGIGCARAGTYGVWVNVAAAVSWLTANIPNLKTYDVMAAKPSSAVITGSAGRATLRQEGASSDDGVEERFERSECTSGGACGSIQQKTWWWQTPRMRQGCIYTLFVLLVLLALGILCRADVL